MADFLTHISPQDASPADYERLDKAMAIANLSKTVCSKRGVVYPMPASYFSQSFNMSADDVRNLAIGRGATDRAALRHRQDLRRRRLLPPPGGLIAAIGVATAMRRLL